MDRILCVEDSAETLLILETTLRGYDFKVASTTERARELLRSEKFDLLLVDIELPDGTGMDLCVDLPEQNQGLPIIFVTGKKDFSAKVTAFALGADDFIQKPFDPKELKLRVDAKVSKHKKFANQSRLLTIGQVTCNLSDQRAYIRTGGATVPVNLTAIEFRILSLLAGSPSKIFARSEIVERVWGYDTSITERAVDVHVSNLLLKLRPSNVDITGVVGSGYQISLTTMG